VCTGKFNVTGRNIGRSSPYPGANYVIFHICLKTYKMGTKRASKRLLPKKYFESCPS